MAVNILVTHVLLHKSRKTQCFEQAYRVNFIKTLRAFSGKMMLKIFASGMVDELMRHFCHKQSRRSHADI